MQAIIAQVARRAKALSAAAVMAQLLAAAGAAQVHQAPSTGLARLRAQIEGERQAAHVAGLAVAIVIEDKIMLAEGFGEADVAAHKPVTPDTLFVVASVSKTVLAAVLMKAVEQSRIALDTPVDRYLPFKIANPLAPGKAPNLRQLASHTSGITDDGGGSAGFYNGPLNYFAGADNPIALGEFLKGYLDAGGAYYTPQNFGSAPGEKENYSNIGAALAGFVIGEAVHEPFDRYCREVLFEPIGMGASGWHMADVQMARHALTYRWSDGRYVAYPFYGLATWPDGGLRTSVRDLAGFVGMVMNRGAWGRQRVLKVSSVDEMLAGAAVSAHPQVPRRAIFWRYLPADDGDNGFGRNIYMHSGADPGVYTVVAFDPAARIAIVLLTNGERNDQAVILKNKVGGYLFNYAASLGTH
jgi:CubicO group peptidase (beta-lactamase class C family)